MNGETVTDIRPNQYETNIKCQRKHTGDESSKQRKKHYDFNVHTCLLWDDALAGYVKGTYRCMLY